MKDDVYYYLAIKKLYETEEYNELYDVLYNYMDAYLYGSKMEAYMLKDECENLIGIREHEDIINEIKKYI